MCLFFYLHFTWLCGWWHHKRILKKKPFWKYDSWFSSKKSKLTLANYPWNDAFSCKEKINFHKYCLLIVIVLAKCTLYFIWRILQPFLRIMTYKKGNACFLDLIFYRQIGLFLAEVIFWHLSRKKSVIFSKWLFFQKSLMMSSAT